MLIDKGKLRVARRPEPPPEAQAAALSLLRGFAPQEGYAEVLSSLGPHRLWDELAGISAGLDKGPVEVTWAMSDGEKHRRGVFCHSPEEAEFDVASSVIFSTWKNVFPSRGAPAALAWRIAVPSGPAPPPS